MAKRGASLLSIITVISIMGVALGVTALIVVLSVMGGFKKDLEEKIIGTKAHIVIQTADDEPLNDPESIMDQLDSESESEIIGMSPYIESEVMVSSPTNLSGVVLRGIDPDRIGTVSQLEENLEKGKLEYLNDPDQALAEIEKERDAELSELLERVRKEREEFEKEVGEEVPDAPSEEATEDLEGEDSYGEEGFMPPLIEEDDSESGGDDAGMPSMFDDAPSESIPGLIVGRELARSLQVNPGQEVNVVTPQGEMGPMGMIPRSRPFRVVGVFYSGMYEFDANHAYTSIESAQSFLNTEGVTGIELKTNNVETSPQVALKLQERLGPSIQVLDWQELNRSLFFALKLEKIAMFVVLTFIILVASFSIIAMLIMIVIEKAREIAVLKALGATNGGVMRTFIYQGTVIGVFGAIIGLVLGLGVCFFLTEYGFPLNSEVYYISTLPVDVDPVEIVSVVVAAILISFLATIYPSVQAARLNPVEGLRDD